MSLREEIAEVRAKKMALPFEMAGYRLIADLEKSDYRVVLRYTHPRQPDHFITENYTNQRSAVAAFVNAPRTMPVERTASEVQK